MPFTNSSNLIAALVASVDRLRNDGGQIGLAARIAERREWTARIRERLGQLGFRVTAPATIAAPAVISFEPPEDIDPAELGQWLEDQGFFLSHRSAYLERRGILQICLMGEVHWSEIAALLAVLAKRVGREEPARSQAVHAAQG